MRGDRGTRLIINELHHDLVRRMRNWARAGAGVGIGALRAIDYGAEYGHGYRESAMPIMLGEAHDTEAALSTIPIQYQQVIRRFWEREGMSLRWHAKQIGIHHHTLSTWLRAGHPMLETAIIQREQKIAAVAAENRRIFATDNEK